MGERLGRILIVDDHELMQRAITRVAAHHGLVTLALLEGSQTMNIALSERPDLIVLDIRMPTVDGRDILKELKRDERTAMIPVFIYSGIATEGDRENAFELGADGYFEKGQDLSLLFTHILEVIERTGSGTYAVRRPAREIKEGQG
jgi:DNA-binding response OmpR family regulator